MAVSSPALSLTNVLTLTEWEKDSETFIDELVSVGAKENTVSLQLQSRCSMSLTPAFPELA